MKKLYNYFGEKFMPLIRLIILILIGLIIWKIPISFMKLICNNNELKSWEGYSFRLWGAGVGILVIFSPILLVCGFIIYILCRWVRYGKF